MDVTYERSITVDLAYEQAVGRTREALAEQPIAREAARRLQTVLDTLTDH